MEQQPLLLHFDTVNATTNINEIVPNSHNPFDCIFNLSNVINKPKKISLKGLEMPLGFNNVRASNNSNTLTVTSNNKVCNVVLTDCNYQTITDLIIAINLFISSSNIYIATDIPIFGISTNNFVTINTNIANNYIIISGNSVLVSNILGFGIIQLENYNGINQMATNTMFYSGVTDLTMIATSAYNLNYDTYFALNFKNLATASNSVSASQIHYKIPLQNGNGSINFLSDGTNFVQTLIVSDPHLCLSQMNIEVRDRFGFKLSNCGLDFSFSLLFEF